MPPLSSWLFFAAMSGMAFAEDRSASFSDTALPTSIQASQSALPSSPPAVATISAAQALQSDASNANTGFFNYIFVICASLIVVLVVWRVVIESVEYVRLLACLTNDTQRYFLKPSQTYATFKQNLLYAPIFRTRHNRELQLSTAINMGTLPTRFQSLFLGGYFGTNVAFCVVSIHWSQPFGTVANELRNRTGMLAVVNMIPLFVMASRNNPLIKCLNISCDTFNLLHRWFGRIVVLESLVHTSAWMAAQVQRNGWSAVTENISENTMMVFGLMAVAALAAMAILGMSPVRHAFYDTFKVLHITLAVLAIIGIWSHLKLAHVPEIYVILGAITVLCLEATLRLFNITYRNIGKGGAKALVEALPGNAVRVTLELARPWTFKPGQHAYLYMPSVGLWQAHPFSLAWSQEGEIPDEKKGLASNRQEVLATRTTSMSFIIRSRTGFTAKLMKKAEAAPDGRFYTKCFAEGPYGGLHKMHSYGTVVLIAGGVGITHQVPHVRDLVAGYSNGTVAARKVVLIWVIQSPEHLEWIRPWMTDILAMDRRREVLRIMLFVSRPRSTKEIHSPSATVQMFPGRPNIETLLDIEIENQIGAMGVSVCGSGALSDDVRRAVRMRQHVSNIDFVEVAFSW